eukprot:9233075-Alexandrium_andersonii.AAC.1
MAALAMEPSAAATLEAALVDIAGERGLGGTCSGSCAAFAGGGFCSAAFAGAAFPPFAAFALGLA